MRRLIAPCACVLALVTGAWIGQAYAIVQMAEGSSLAVSGEHAWTGYRNESDRPVMLILATLATG